MDIFTHICNISVHPPVSFSVPELHSEPPPNIPFQILYHAVNKQRKNEQKYRKLFYMYYFLAKHTHARIVSKYTATESSFFIKIYNVYNSKMFKQLFDIQIGKSSR